MKQKINLLICFLMMSLFSVHAEDVIVSAGTTNSNAYPFNSYYYTSVTQSLYRADEINRYGIKKGTINALAFDVDVPSEFRTYGVLIYLAHTNKEKFYSTSDYVKESDLTLVYCSQPTIGADEGWENYSFTTPFEYDGRSNLAVVVCRKSNGQNQTLKYGCDYKSDMVINKGKLNASGAEIDGDYSLVAGSRPNLRLSFDDEQMVEIKGFEDIIAGVEEYPSFFEPYCSAAKYSTVYNVYSPDEMHHSGTITEIAYFLESRSSFNPEEVSIYMGVKDGDQFNDVNDYPVAVPTLGKNNMTLVYHGSPTLGSVYGWDSLPLNTPFVYDNSKSLVVAVCKKSSNINQAIKYRTSYYDRTVELSRFSSVYEEYGELSSNKELEAKTSRPNTKFRILKGELEGDTDVIIGETSVLENNDPFDVSSLYSTHQILYRANEIGKKMTITDIAFNVSEASETPIRDLRIYMAHSSEEKFPVTITKPDGECVDASNFKLVYMRGLSVGKETGWENIHLDTPFEYDGVRSLVIAVCHGSDCRNMNLRYHQVNTNFMSQLCRASDYEQDANLESDYYMGYYCRPQIRLTGIVKLKTVSGINYRFNDDLTATVLYSPEATGNITIPSMLTNGGMDYDVTKIDETAFINNIRLTGITIPLSVEAIGMRAFVGCSNLTEFIMNCPPTCTFGSNALFGASGYKIIVPALTTHSWINTAMWSTYGLHFTEPSFTLHANQNPDNNDAGFYTTFYNSHYAYDIPDGVKAYTAQIVEENDETVVKLTAIEGNVLPNDEAVLLYSDVTADMEMKINEAGTTIVNNDFQGVDVETSQSDFGNYNYYMLSYGQNQLGFYKMPLSTKLAANKAFIVQPSSTNAKAMRMVFVENEVEGIEYINDGLNINPTEIYSVCGLHQNKLQKGINIVNGKKVLVK